MKLAITGTLNAPDTTPLVFRGPYEQIVPLAAKAGFDAIELHVQDSSHLDRKHLKELMEKNHISLSSIGTSPAYTMDHISLSHEDPAIRLSAVQRIKDHIITAADYRAVVIIGLIKGMIKDCSGKNVYISNLKQSFDELLPFAEERGVLVVLETINRYESDFLNTIKEGLDFIRQFPGDNLKLHIDTFHMNIEEADIPRAIKSAAGKIGHCHAADNDRWYPGHGHYNFAETFKTLSEINYDRFVAVECFMYPNQEEAARKAYKFLSNCMNNKGDYVQNAG
jgi:sugar phosphate isomerase/epimerase